ncbi:hypothetical protein SDC9_160347 [bioreactor metagenome]|uniref:Uncharacterized protein n=1 Tax=bioreactor metagenome TaxID=1076179 RepID=A0A645FFD4_9ZZZZ
MPAVVHQQPVQWGTDRVLGGGPPADEQRLRPGAGDIEGPQRFGEVFGLIALDAPGTAAWRINIQHPLAVLVTDDGLVAIIDLRGVLVGGLRQQHDRELQSLCLVNRHHPDRGPVRGQPAGPLVLVHRVGLFDAAP